MFSYSILTKKKKTIKKELFNFDLKIMVNPFEKIQYGNATMKVFINALFGLFSRLKHY